MTEKFTHFNRVFSRYAWACLLIFIILTNPQESFSQGEKPASDDQTLLLASKLTEFYEIKVEEIVSRHIPKKHFQVIVDITAKEKNEEEIPYLPKAFGVGGLSNLPPQLLSKSVAKITIVVYLAEKYSETTKTGITNLVKSKLSLNLERGDSINFEMFAIENISDNEEYESKIRDVKSDLAVAEDRVSSITGERNELKQELSTAKEKLKSIEEETGKSPEALIQKFKIPFFVVMGTLILGLLLVFTLSMKILSGSIKSVGGAFGGIGDSIRNIASALEKVGGRKPEEKESSQNDAAGKQVAGASGGGGDQGKNTQTSMDMKTLQDRVLQLHEEIVAKINEKTLPLVVLHVSTLLNNPVSIAKGVVSLEILGKDMANDIFKRLSYYSQEIIIRFLNQANYGDKTKLEVMMEAGEELNTKLMAGGFESSRVNLSYEVSEKLLLLEEKDLFTVVQKCDDDVLQRLFVYFDAAKISRLLAELKKQNINNLERYISALLNVPHKQNDKTLDGAIVEILTELFVEKARDLYGPYLEVYRDVIENAGEELDEQIINVLSRGNERIRDYLATRVVTFQTFFKIPPKNLSTIVDGLSNREIAALASGIAPEQRTQILGQVSERRRPLIDEEIEGIEAMEETTRSEEVRKVKQRIVSIMKVEITPEVLKSIAAENASSSPQAA